MPARCAGESTITTGTRTPSLYLKSAMPTVVTSANKIVYAKMICRHFVVFSSHSIRISVSFAAALKMTTKAIPL